MPHLITIGGPTASGKTALAIALAQRLNTFIISADSRQFYREMRIGNARPTPAELAAAPHYFVADRSVQNPLSAGAFAREALALLAQKWQDGERPGKKRQYAILVGGSGLYLDALTVGLNEFPPVTPAARQRVAELSQRKGTPGLAAALARADPAYFEQVDQNNPRRLQRALEVCWSADRPYSDFLAAKEPRPFTPHYFTPDLTTLAREATIPPAVGRHAPGPERRNLYARIERRLDEMLAAGLMEEVKSLLPHRDLAALRTVGYQEFFPHLAGEYSLERAIELAKRNSRRYAKRQITWFGREQQYQPVEEVEDILRSLPG